jgi:hypothetical protein
LAKVSGVVTYKGQPVEGAVVAFHCNTASVPATGTTDASGRFTLTTLTPGDGAVPGEHKITITKNKVEGVAATGPVSMDDAAKSGPVNMKETNSLPKRYANADVSPLKQTVAKDKPNEFKLELVD